MKYYYVIIFSIFIVYVYSSVCGIFWEGENSECREFTINYNTTSDAYICDSFVPHNNSLQVYDNLGGGYLVEFESNFDFPIYQKCNYGECFVNNITQGPCKVFYFFCPFNYTCIECDTWC